MTATEIDNLRKKINTEIQKMEAKIEAYALNTKPISPENSIGRVSRMDAINNKSVSEAALRSAKRKLASLKFALTKLGSPDFGVCARCGRPIQIGRLMYMPESNECIACAR